jgi:hypothetical protein
VIEVAPGLRRWTAYHEHWEEPLRNRGVEGTDAFSPGDELPGGLEAFRHRARERGRLLAAQAALGRGRRRAPRRRRQAAQRATRCGSAPERWLGKGTHDDLRETLQPLLALPVQRVLVSQGEPGLRAGKAALARLLR